LKHGRIDNVHTIDDYQIRKVDRALTRRAFAKQHGEECSQVANQSLVHWRRKRSARKTPPKNKIASVDCSGIQGFPPMPAFFTVDARRALRCTTRMTSKKSSRVLLSLVIFLLGAAVTARADVQLHRLFSDNMVLQQGVAVPVWGLAAEGETVTVEFRNQKVKTTAKDGRWMVRLKKLKPGGPDVLTVAGKNTLSVKNVLVGEVWIASGQSNMEWPMRLSYEAEKEIAATANPLLRLYTVPKLRAQTPTNNVNASWQECNPGTTPSFSAVAYYFGRELQKARGVPVGIIHTSWGGSPAEVWMSRDMLTDNPSYQKTITDSFQVPWERYQAALKKFQDDSARLKAEGKAQTNRPPAMPWRPTELYNGMIAPLIPYAIKGAIWYQGESNAGRAHEYRTLFADMIRNWRRDWGQGDFTFLAVQLAPFKKIQPQPAESDWAELREAQYLATKALPKVGIAVINDVGEENDIHPKKKEPVGVRLALAARGIAYGEKIVYAGPTYKSVKFQNGTAVLSFNNVDGGLEVRTPAVQHAEFSPDGKRVMTTTGDGTARIWDATTGNSISNEPNSRYSPSLTGFAIAGEDRKFVWAKAEIQGNKIVVSSPQVSHPFAVRFGWADYPVVNLWNKAGLPAVPFRTDDFPMVTARKE
jgi:sialate O-acetylesterase